MLNLKEMVRFTMSESRSRLFTCFLALGMASSAGIANAVPFTLGNLLVTHRNQLHEYQLDGTLVQTIPVPHPDTIYNFKAADVVYDRFGRAHVVLENGSSSYIATYNPATDHWTYTSADVHSSNVGDRDLAIWGDYIYSNGNRIDVTTFAIDTFEIGMGGGESETSVGRDGLLYSLQKYTPRPDVQRTDPVTLENIGPKIILYDAEGYRTDAHGITATENGEIFVVDFDGQIYHYDSDGNLLADIYTGTRYYLDLDLRGDGILAAGARFGDVTITDTSFGSVSTITVGDYHTYVGFVEVPLGPAVPEPSTYVMSGLALLGLGFLAWRRRESRR